MSFTRDYPDHEIEMKFNINLENGLSFDKLFDEFRKSFEGRGIGSFFRLRELGTQPTEVRSWKYPISYHGVHGEDGSKQVYMLVHGLCNLFVFPNIKVFSLNEADKVVDRPLVRREDKTHSKKMSYWRYCQLHRQLEEQYGNIVEFGRLVRYKKWFYIQNRDSGRNYSFTMDECSVKGKGEKLVQLEIEYKGRAGKHTPGGADPVCEELIAFAKILMSRNNQSKLVLTSQTKSKWLLDI